MPYSLSGELIPLQLILAADPLNVFFEIVRVDVEVAIFGADAAVAFVDCLHGWCFLGWWGCAGVGGWVEREDVDPETD